MSFRINVSAHGDRTIVELAGKLTAEAVPELVRIASPEPSAVTLDLSQVQSVDGVAASALKTLRDQGADLVGIGPYVALLLDH